MLHEDVNYEGITIGHSGHSPDQSWHASYVFLSKVIDRCMNVNGLDDQKCTISIAFMLMLGYIRKTNKQTKSAAFS